MFIKLNKERERYHAKRNRRKRGLRHRQGLIIQHRSLDYSGVVFGGAQQEKERLRAAINAFMQKTEQLRDRLQASAGEKEAAILDGHMEMLRDPFMLSQWRR